MLLIIEKNGACCLSSVTVNNSLLLSESTFSTPSTSSSLTRCSTPLESTPKRIPLASTFWAYNFEIDGNLFAPHLKKMLEDNVKLKPKYRRQLVREFVTAVSAVCQQNPSRKAVEVLANRLVAKFPCMKEQIDGTVIGSGCDGLILNIVRRVENESRKKSEENSNAIDKAERKRGIHVQEFALKKPKQDKQDSFGCINYSPTVCERDNQEKIREELKEAYRSAEGRKNKNLIEDHMNATYPLQRESILALKTVSFLSKEWPFLFSTVGIDRHFQTLVGKSAVECMVSSLETKGPRILKFLEECGSKKVSYVLYSIAKAKQVNDAQAKSAGVVLGVMEHFCEESDVLFKCIEVNEAVHYLNLLYSTLLYSVIYSYYQRFLWLKFNITRYSIVYLFK